MRRREKQLRELFQGTQSSGRGVNMMCKIVTKEMGKSKVLNVTVEARMRSATPFSLVLIEFSIYWPEQLEFLFQSYLSLCTMASDKKDKSIGTINLTGMSTSSYSPRKANTDLQTASVCVLQLWPPRT